jgi:hypothetical protein
MLFLQRSLGKDELLGADGSAEVSGWVGGCMGGWVLERRGLQYWLFDIRREVKFGLRGRGHFQPF